MSEFANGGPFTTKRRVIGKQAHIYMSPEEKQNAPHGLFCSREQAIALEVSGVDCDCWKKDL